MSVILLYNSDIKSSNVVQSAEFFHKKTGIYPRLFMKSFRLRLEPTVRVQRERAEAGRAFFEADIVCKKKVCMVAGA